MVFICDAAVNLHVVGEASIHSSCAILMVNAIVDVALIVSSPEVGTPFLVMGVLSALNRCR